LPSWLELGAERAVGAVILVLAGRVLLKWLRGDYHATSHAAARDVHRHLHEGEPPHAHARGRTPRQAFAIGVLHGLAGTGTVSCC